MDQTIKRRGIYAKSKIKPLKRLSLKWQIPESDLNEVFLDTSFVLKVGRFWRRAVLKLRRLGYQINERQLRYLLDKDREFYKSKNCRV